MSVRPLIHIGYHKTATTWMQSRLFVPEHGFRQIADHGDVFDAIVQPHGLRFDPRKMQDLIVDRSGTLGEGVVPVISSELLCGNPFYGGRESDVFAERLRSVVQDARILVSIRSQMRILPSIYMQYLSRGGTMSPKLFFREKPTPGYYAFDAAHLEYDVLLSKYQDLFGHENVHVLTQESLAADMDGAARALAVFSRNRVFTGLTDAARGVFGASYPEHAAPFLRRVNHVQRSQLNPTPIIALGRTPHGLYRATGYALRHHLVASRLGSYRPVSEYVRKCFAGRFADSNARLSELTGGVLDLSAYE